MNLAPIFITVSIMLGLPPGLLSAVCSVESNHKASAINMNDGGSPSIGACQLKEKTARHMGYKGSKEFLYKEPRVNVYYAGKFLKYQLDRNDDNVLKAVSAYNAGHYSPRNLRYVHKVLTAWAQQHD